MSEPSRRKQAAAATLEPPREPSAAEIPFRNNPVLFVELARDWAAGGEAPTVEHEAWLKSIPRRRIRQPDSAREAFWGILSAPERGRTLAWLDKVGLLEELIPIWFGEPESRELHLRAVEELHLERWAKGLSKRALQKLNAYMDQRVDGRLNGWALAGLATLVIESNGYTERYNERLNEELRELGATDGERMRVMTAVIEYPFLRIAFRKDGEYAESNFSPATVVAALSMLFGDDNIKDDVRAKSVVLADGMLTK
jgi:hypothetical protein